MGEDPTEAARGDRAGIPEESPEGVAGREGRRQPLVRREGRRSEEAVEVNPCRLLGRKVQLALDLYGCLDGRGYLTGILVHLQYAFYGLALFLVGAKVEGNLDPLAHEQVVLDLHLARHVGVEAILVEGNLTRFQRAVEGAQQ